MSVGVITAIVVGSLLVLLGTGMWIAMALGLTGIVALAAFTPFRVADIAALQAWNRSSLFALSSLPMFILTGELVIHSRLSKWLFDGLAPWIAWLPGRLLHTNVIGCTIFAGISGSSVATALAIGKVTYGELSRRGYDEKLSVGSLAGAGTLGILIPPSIVAILYASVVGESVGQLFLAGVVPGLIVSGLFVGWIVFRGLVNPEIVPALAEPYTWVDRWRGIVLMAPALALILLMLGTIYSGIATPTEAAGLGVGAAIILGVSTRSLSFKNFVNALVSTSRTTAFIMLIIVGATFVGIAGAYIKLPATVASGILGLTDNVYLVLLLLSGVYIILGMLLDPNSMVLLTLPVIIPTIDTLGIDRVWFYVYIVIMCELANVTPPVGFNLYVIQGLTGKSMNLVARGAFPFMVLMAVAVVIITIFPELCLWLPKRMIS